MNDGPRTSFERSGCHVKYKLNDYWSENIRSLVSTQGTTVLKFEMC